MLRALRGAFDGGESAGAIGVGPLIGLVAPAIKRTGGLVIGEARDSRFAAHHAFGLREGVRGLGRRVLIAD